VLPPDELTPLRISRLLRDGTRWQFALGADDRGEAPRDVKSPGDFARSLAFCPVMVGNQVVVADARHVWGIDLRTGKREAWLDATRLAVVKDNPRLPAPPDLRYTVTAADGCVFVRMGTQALRAEPDADADSLLACLELEPGEGSERLRWSLAASAVGKNTFFEGAPVVGDGLAYVAVTRVDGGKATTAVHCYAVESRERPVARWKRDVCSTRDADGGSRFRHHLLTLAGPHLFYCNHAGAVVALDSSSGKAVWGLRYRRDQEEDAARQPAPHDLNPPLYADGRLYVAPADSDMLLCLDPVTGRRLWERERVVATQLLGVTGGRLVFTTRTPSAGLRAVRAADGADRGGWFQPAGGGAVHSFGRGLLAGDLILWPTVRHVHVVQAEDGEPADDPSLLHDLPPGNLAYAGGTLVVTDRGRLHVFTPTRTLPPPPGRPLSGER
jgi:outer membrane protein assembly factor BamB